MESGSSLQGDNLRLSECLCPVCLSILVEPVTMPCEHELCMPCFKQNVEEANFTCPLCRKRISTWTRRATKNKTLVNKKRWLQIQQAFPDKVHKRLHGIEDDSETESELASTPSISQPGALRDEYLMELKRVQDEQEQQRKIEEEASNHLIQQLTAEEDEQERERQRIQMEDEEFAHNLSANFNQETGLVSPGFNKMLCGSFKGGTSGSLSKQSSASHLPTFLDQYLVKTPKQSDFLSASTSRPGTYQAAVDESSRASTRLSELGKEDKLPSLPFIDIKDESSDSSALVISPYEPSWQPASSHESSSIDGILSDDQSSRSSLLKEERCLSSASEDSIGQELVHFKPIHSSPCTPPRSLPNGKEGAKPPLLRPLNLSARLKEQDHDGPQIPLTSPIIRKQLSELQSEHSLRVKAMSKSTCTEVQSPPKKRLLKQHLYSEKYSDKSDSGTSSGVSPSFPLLDSGIESDFDDLKKKPLTKTQTKDRKGLVKTVERSSSALNSASGNLIAWLKLQQSSEKAPMKRSHSSIDCNQNCIHSQDSDYLLALKLQAEFDIEAKYRLTALRKKGCDGEYSLRRKRSRVS